MNISNEDLLFIEQWYTEFEYNMNAIGKKYTRPANYIERGIKLLNAPRKAPLRHLHKEGRVREDYNY